MKVLLPYLIGAASAFVVQFLVQVYVVPLTETHKRRLERWEKDVLDLGELLSGTISDLAGEAETAQQRFRWAVEMEARLPGSELPPYQAELDRLVEVARIATRALNDQVNFRSDWLMDRISLFRPSDKVVRFTQASLQYRRHVMKPSPREWQEQSDASFEAWWRKERELRTKLITCTRDLAYDRDSLRISPRQRARMVRFRVKRRVEKIRRKPIESEPVAADAVPDAAEAGQR